MVRTGSGLIQKLHRQDFLLTVWDTREGSDQERTKGFQPELHNDGPAVNQDGKTVAGEGLVCMGDIRSSAGTGYVGEIYWTSKWRHSKDGWVFQSGVQSGRQGWGYKLGSYQQLMDGLEL